MSSDYDKSVFLNFPFDAGYISLSRACFFTVMACGFKVRCALEVEDSSDVRLTKIQRIIRECRLGIHDISRTELDPQSGLPRLNMALELGLFLGAKENRDKKQKLKSCLILDSDKFRYQQFISDISGQDIKAHANDCQQLIVTVRNWLNAQRVYPTIIGGAAVCSRFEQFVIDLPSLSRNFRFDDPVSLPYADFLYTVAEWLRASP